MQFEVDKDEFESAGYYDHKLIVDQKVTLYIVDYKEKTSGKGYPQLTIDNDVMEAVNDPDWKFNDRIFHTITFIPKGLPGHGIAVHFFKVLGFKPDEQGIMDIDLDSLIGKQYRAFAYVERGADGRKYQRVRNFEPIEPSDAMPTEAPRQEPAPEDDVPF